MINNILKIEQLREYTLPVIFIHLHLYSTANKCDMKYNSAILTTTILVSFPLFTIQQNLIPMSRATRIEASDTVEDVVTVGVGLEDFITSTDSHIGLYWASLNPRSKH